VFGFLALVIRSEAKQSRATPEARGLLRRFPTPDDVFTDEAGFLPFVAVLQELIQELAEHGHARGADLAEIARLRLGPKRPGAGEGLAARGCEIDALRLGDRRMRIAYDKPLLREEGQHLRDHHAIEEREIGEPCLRGQFAGALEPVDRREENKLQVRQPDRLERLLEPPLPALRDMDGFEAEARMAQRISAMRRRGRLFLFRAQAWALVRT
jgi:hypothetical protein